jgi:hypothetical protein
VETAEKVRENKLRRMAERRGLRLVKSRRRDPGALTYGRYFVQAPDGSTAAGYETEHGLTMDEVERRMSSTEAGPPAAAREEGGS